MMAEDITKVDETYEATEKGGALKSFEIWREDQVVLLLDTFPGGYTIEWYTRKRPDTIVTDVKSVYDLPDTTPVTCVPKEVEEMGQLSSSIQSVHRELDSLEDCTFLKINPEYSGLVFTWSADEPSPTLSVTKTEGKDLHLDDFQKIFKATVDDTKISDMSIVDSIETAVDTIKDQVDTSHFSFSKFTKHL